MASALVRSALSIILTGSTFNGASERSKTSCKQIIALLDKVTEDGYCDMFEDFSSQLLACLEFFVSTANKGLVGCAIKREQLIWTTFHQNRTTELAFLWKEFLLSIRLDLDALVFQKVNQALYEDKVKTHFAVASGSVTSQTANLSHEEACILHYAAGYVPFIMLRKYENCTSDTSVQYMECLSNMAICMRKLIF